MKCPEVVEWMHRYLDYDLNQEETADMFEHIAVCPECADTFRVLKLLSRELEDLPVVAPKYSLVDAIMPQLDALDRARKEKSATVDNIPAEMTPMTPTPILQPKDRRRKFMGSTAGRTMIGVVAAGVILGVAILNYSPQELSDAQVQLSEVTSSSDPMETSGNATITNGASGDVSKKDVTGIQEPSAFMKSENPTKGESSASSDLEGNKQETLSTDPSDSKPTDQMKANETDNKAPVIQPNKKNPTIENNKQVSPNSNNKEQPTSNDEVSSSLDESKKVATNDGSNSDSSGGSGNYDVNATDKKVADTGNVAKDIVAPKLPVTDPLQDELSGMMSIVPPNDKTSSNKSAVTALEWSSPNNKYVSVLEGQKLIINQLPVVGSDQPSTTMQTIDLTGTWISGEWSSDSMIFTYQLNQEGKVVGFTYHVDKVPVKSP